MTKPFYHFTHRGNLPSITKQGLRANVPDPSHLMSGEAVVWLTVKETQEPSEQDIAFLKLAEGSLFSAPEVGRFSQHLFGTPGDARIEVRLGLANRRLFNYGTWLRRNDLDLEGRTPPSPLRDWYIYFGNIQPRRLWIQNWTHSNDDGIVIDQHENLERV